MNVTSVSLSISTYKVSVTGTQRKNIFRWTAELIDSGMTVQEALRRVASTYDKQTYR